MNFTLSLKKWLPNKHLLLIKIVLFTYHGAMFSLIPYLVVHMKQIGISVHETAVIHAILPVAMFVGPPISGFIADKFGGFKVLLFVALLMVGTCHTALLWVPQVRGGASLNTVEVFCGSEETNVHINYMVPVEDCSANERIAGRLTDCIAECPQTYSHSGQPPGSPEVAFCSMSLHSGRNTCLSFNSNSSTYMLVMPPKNGSVSVNEDLRHISFSSKSQINSTFNSCKNLHENNCTLVCVPSSSLDQLWVSKCGDRTVTFWLYLIIRILAAIFMSSCFILLDSITLCTIEGHNTDYGKQRLWPVLATAIFPPVTGFLVDYFSPSEDTTNYSPTFYVQDALLVVTAFLSTFLTVKLTTTPETNLQTVLRLMKTPRVDCLLAGLFVLGTMWGFIEVFLYWYLLDLNSPKYLLGLTLTVGSGIGVPVLFFSQTIIDKIGHVNIVFSAFMFYCVRYIGYSFIYNPWWSLIFEAMEIFTLHVLWVAVVNYSHKLAPKAVLATMQGAIGGTHYGVGRGSGSLIGGLLMGKLGARDTFRYMGIAAAVSGVVYLAVEKIFFRKPIETEKNEKTNSNDTNERETNDTTQSQDKDKVTSITEMAEKQTPSIIDNNKV